MLARLDMAVKEIDERRQKEESCSEELEALEFDKEDNKERQDREN